MSEYIIFFILLLYYMFYFNKQLNVMYIYFMNYLVLFINQ